MRSKIGQCPATLNSRTGPRFIHEQEGLLHAVCVVVPVGSGLQAIPQAGTVFHLVGFDDQINPSRVPRTQLPSDRLEKLRRKINGELAECEIQPC